MCAKLILPHKYTIRQKNVEGSRVIILRRPLNIPGPGEAKMEISITQYDCCDLVRPSGRVDSFTAPALAESLNKLVTQDRHRIILDLAAVNYVSSAGMRVLIDVQKSCKRPGRGELILLNVPTRVRETLELAGFVPLFKIFDGLDKALEYFSTLK